MRRLAGFLPLAVLPRFTALVPWVLTVLASASVADASEYSLEVLVFDAAGDPCPGVPIALGWRPVLPEGFERRMSIDQFVEKTRTDDDGVVTFEVPDDEKTRERAEFFVRLGLVEETPHERLLDGDREITFELPECGTVEVQVPTEMRGEVFLRVFDEEERLSLFDREEPSVVEIVDGRAVFPWVELDLELQYRIFPKGMSSPIEGCLTGPSVEGEIVSYTPPGLSGPTTLDGRLLDEDLAPIANREVAVSIQTSGGSTGDSLTTDAAGHFSVPLSGPAPPSGARRSLFLRAAWRNEKSREALGDASATIDLSEALGPGVHDLGDIVLAIPGSEKLLGRLSDAELMEAYRKYVSLRESLWVEGCLLEMARRGTEFWIGFLSEELERVNRENLSWLIPPNKTEVPEGVTLGNDLEYLTVLRRAQRLVDPLAVLLDEASVLDVVFPDSAIAVCRLENRDTRGASLAITEGGSYRSGRFARCRVIAHAENGSLLECLPSPSSMGGGMQHTRTLAPGEFLTIALPLTSYVRFDTAGKFEARVFYHDSRGIADSRSDGMGVVSSSPSFVIHVRPRTIELATSDADRIRRWIEEIDENQPVLVLNDPVPGEGELSGAAEKPEENLLRTGYLAVPVLLDRLGEPELSPKRRAWVFGLLWDLTGLLAPTRQDLRGAVGSMRLATAFTSADGGVTVGGHGLVTGPISVEAQRALTARWLEVRPGFVVRYRDR